MKIRHPLFVGLVAAFTVWMAIVAVGAVAAETPFKGTVSAVETGVTVFPIRTIDRQGTGTATYLGKYTEHVTAQINVLTMHGIGSRRSLRRTATPCPRAMTDRQPGRVPPRSRLSRSTPSPAGRDGSLTQPARSRWKAPWIRRRALAPAPSAGPSTTRCRRGGPNAEGASLNRRHCWCSELWCRQHLGGGRACFLQWDPCLVSRRGAGACCRSDPGVPPDRKGPRIPTGGHRGCARRPAALGNRRGVSGRSRHLGQRRSPEGWQRRDVKLNSA